MPEHWYRCGLERLRGLVHVQDVLFLMYSIDKLTEAEATWMAQHWLELKTVRVTAINVGLHIWADQA